jgi:hypothetical protein
MQETRLWIATVALLLQAFSYPVEVFLFLRDLQVKRRDDERTRTAYPCSSYECAVRGCRALHGICKSRISKRFFVLSIADYCRALRAG